MTMVYSRKRRSSGRFGLAYKRRRYNKKPLRFRARRGYGTKGWTMQTIRPYGNKYKSRRLSRKAWRRVLWRDTLTDTHYRSVGNGSIVIATPAVQATSSVTVLYPTFVGVPSLTTAFWTATGGAQPHDTGVAVPTFIGDITLRGGVIGIVISVLDAVVLDVACTVFTVALAKNADVSKLPATIVYGGDASDAADFADFGRILDKKEYIMNYQNPSFTVERRLRVQKIDQEQWATKLGQQIVFVVQLANLQSGAAVNVQTTTYHNLSFSADVQ